MWNSAVNRNFGTSSISNVEVLVAGQTDIRRFLVEVVTVCDALQLTRLDPCVLHKTVPFRTVLASVHIHVLNS